MAASLAKELGLSESKVKAALEDFMPEGGPPTSQARKATTTAVPRSGPTSSPASKLIATNTNAMAPSSTSDTPRGCRLTSSAMKCGCVSTT